MDTTASLFRKLVDLMKQLRSPGGCPWDRKQTYRSLKPCLIEETCEIVDGIDKKRPAVLREELGDLLYIIIFFAQIARERKEFCLDDVMRDAYQKLVRRHPHVFGAIKLKGPDAVIEHWHRIKAREVAHRPTSSVLDEIPVMLSALHKAMKVQRKVVAAGYAIDTLDASMQKLKRHCVSFGRKRVRGKAAKDVGDMLFALVNFCRILHINPEEELHQNVYAFIREFKRAEKKVKRRRN